jgi:hypothetical protein
MRVMICVLLALVLLSAPATAAQLLQSGNVAAQNQGTSTRFTLIGDGRYISLSVPSGWKVNAMRNTPPASIVSFNIVDPALPDHGASLGIIVTVQGSDADKVADARGAQDHASMTLGAYKDWTIHAGTREPSHDPALIDADKKLGGATVRLRMAYEPSYARIAMALLNAVLDSIDGATGTYTLHPGEAVRGNPIQ